MGMPQQRQQPHTVAMPASVASAPVQRTARTPASRTKKSAGAAKSKAVNGATNGVAHSSPYEIMASRIANRVAEMAENYTFVEREKYVTLTTLIIPLIIPSTPSIDERKG